MSIKDAHVSIIIPTYNRAAYVTMAIKSVLDQSYKDYEIIVIDDGSTDSTRDVLEPYCDRILYIYQENKGVSAARNTGIQKAKGEWVAFLDSDDEWLPNKLEIQMGYVKKYPNICLHATNMDIINQHGDYTDLFNMKGFGKIVGESLLIDRPLTYILQYNFAYPSAVLVKKSSLIKAGIFIQELEPHEDTDIFYRISLEGPWGVYGFPLVKKFRRDEPQKINLSDRIAGVQLDHYKIIVKILERLLQMKMFTKGERRLTRRILSHFNFLVGLTLKADGKRGVRYWFFRGFMASPSLKIFIKWILCNLPLVTNLVAAKLNPSMKKRTEIKQRK